MDDYLRSDAPVIEALDRAWDRSRLSVSTRLARLRSRAFLLVQCAVAAGVAWWLAADVLGHRSPFFAPVVAVICLGMSYGQRQRRVIEVAIGVAVGVFVADVFVQLAGSGPWQIAVVVLVSMGAASLLDGGPVLVTQAAVQGIVVAALAPLPVRPSPAGPTRSSAVLSPSSRRRSCRRRRYVDPAWLRPRRYARSASCCAAPRRAQATATSRRPPRCSPRPEARSRCCASCRRRPTRGCRSSRAHPSSASTRRTCARWSSSSSRSTGRCAAPGCSCGGSPSPSAGGSSCRPVRH